MTSCRRNSTLPAPTRSPASEAGGAHSVLCCDVMHCGVPCGVHCWRALLACIWLLRQLVVWRRGSLLCMLLPRPGDIWCPHPLALTSLLLPTPLRCAMLAAPPAAAPAALAARLVAVCHSVHDVLRLPAGPKVVLATGQHCDYGMARQLLLHWGANPRNAVVFTQPPRVRMRLACVCARALHAMMHHRIKMHACLDAHSTTCCLCPCCPCSCCLCPWRAAPRKRRPARSPLRCWRPGRPARCG